MGFRQRKQKVAWLHLASLFLCIITSPSVLSAPNRIPPVGSSGSSSIEDNSSSSSSIGGDGQSSTSTNSSSSTIYTMLSQGESRMDFDNQNKSAIFLLGNKGSGQAALAQTIVENYQLETSSTGAPEYMVNRENSVAFYNFPGFETSGTPESETASAYFMERVTKHVTQVKFMFTATHSSVQQTSGAGSGINAEFDLMVTNAAKLMTPAETGKFTNSIGLVITNVQDAGISDQEVLSRAEAFFISYKQQLTVQLNEQGLEAEARILVQRKITFMEALLRRAPGGDLSLNSIWFLRTTSSGSPETGQPSNQTTTERPTTPSIPSNPTTTDQPTTPSIPSNPITTEKPGNSGNARITDLYLNRIQFSSVTHTDFTISIATQTLTTIQSTFMPQITSIMQSSTSLAVTNVFTSYTNNFFQSAFISSGSSLNSALASLNLDYKGMVQSELVSLSDGVTPIFTHPLDQTTNVFHLDVLVKLGEFLHLSFPAPYLTSMSAMTQWVVFFQQVTNTSRSGPTITETAVMSTFNQVHVFRDRVSREICSANCESNGGGGGLGDFPFHLR